MTTPPIAVDIDGTLTRPQGGIDPRIFEPLADWPAPVVVATGKAFPYPVALCHFIGLPERVIAETGGLVYGEETVHRLTDPDQLSAVVRAYQQAGHDLGWGPTETVNRWRETELAVARSQPLAPLEVIASEHGLEVIDSGYAYHVKDPAVSKGRGLEIMADLLDRSPTDFVALGDSANDVSLFEAAGRGIAVGNAAPELKTVADTVLTDEYATATLAALRDLRDQ